MWQRVSDLSRQAWHYFANESEGKQAGAVKEMAYDNPNKNSAGVLYRAQALQEHKIDSSAVLDAGFTPTILSGGTFMADTRDTQSTGHKEAAVQFLQLVTEGRIDKAYQMYADMAGRHHNAYYPAGFPALQKGMIENQAQFPNKQFTIKHVLGEGDLVAVHSHVVLTPAEPGFSMVHLLRFQGNKIVEMWDVGQAVPKDSPNKDGAF